MLQTPTLLAVAIPALAAGVLAGVLIGRRGKGEATAPATGNEPAGRPEGAERVRSQALEAAAEPVLIVGTDGRVIDCNAAALTLLDRHRPAVTGLDASAVRALVSPSGLQMDWGELVASRSPWSGEAHVRLPDGSRQVIAVRLVPVFSVRGDLAALVEVYHELPNDALLSSDRFLHTLDAGGETGDEDEPGDAAQRELRLLSMGFADLDRVLRQYELLLPAMRAEDPLAEAIAGLAAETSEVATSADVPRLLQEIPRTLARLRAQMLRLAERHASGTRGRD